MLEGSNNGTVLHENRSYSPEERKWNHVKKTTPLDISLWQFCQNPIVLERENFKIITYPLLAFWSFLVLKRLDFDKVLTVKCEMYCFCNSITVNVSSWACELLSVTLHCILRWVTVQIIPQLVADQRITELSRTYVHRWGWSIMARRISFRGFSRSFLFRNRPCRAARASSHCPRVKLLQKNVKRFCSETVSSLSNGWTISWWCPRSLILTHINCDFLNLVHLGIDSVYACHKGRTIRRNISF